MKWIDNILKNMNEGEKRAFLYLIKNMEYVKENSSYESTVDIKELLQAYDPNHKNNSKAIKIETLLSNLNARAYVTTVETDESGVTYKLIATVFAFYLYENGNDPQSAMFRFSNLFNSIIEYEHWINFKNDDYLIDLEALNGDFYATNIFQKLYEHLSDSPWEWAIDDMRAYLKCEDKYKLFSNFETKVIIPAIKAIEKNTNFHIRYIKLKNAQKIVALSFTVKSMAKKRAQIVATATNSETGIISQDRQEKQGDEKNEGFRVD